MRVFGLTGGIASGKSTVARMFAELGVPVVDADRVAREVVEPGQPALAEIVAAFGDDVLDGDGRLDRKALGARVFADPEKRVQLNRITHPRIAAATASKLAALGTEGHAIAIYEAALLVENNLQRNFAGLIVVAVNEATQRARLGGRDGFDAAAIDQRLAAQAPLADKLAAATYIVDNNGDVATTRAQVERIYKEISETP